MLMGGSGQKTTRGLVAQTQALKSNNRTIHRIFRLRITPLRRWEFPLMLPLPVLGAAGVGQDALPLLDVTPLDVGFLSSRPHALNDAIQWVATRSRLPPGPYPQQNPWLRPGSPLGVGSDFCSHQGHCWSFVSRSHCPASPIAPSSPTPPPSGHPATQSLAPRPGAPSLACCPEVRAL